MKPTVNHKITMLSRYEEEPHMSPRFKTPCARPNYLIKLHGHTPTYRDPSDPPQRVIKLNSYLGLDHRGHRALYALKSMVKNKFTDEYGERTGTGILGNKL